MNNGTEEVEYRQEVFVADDGGEKKIKLGWILNEKHGVRIKNCDNRTVGFSNIGDLKIGMDVYVPYFVSGEYTRAVISKLDIEKGGGVAETKNCYFDLEFQEDRGWVSICQISKASLNGKNEFKIGEKVIEKISEDKKEFVAVDDKLLLEVYETVSKSMIEEVKTLRKKNAELSGRYHELLYAVSSKYPNETRHETALRYIKQQENQCIAPQSSIR